jgi:hypothetical protein
MWMTVRRGESPSDFIPKLYGGNSDEQSGALQFLDRDEDYA